MDAGLVGELAHKTKPADTASETSSLPEQKGFRGFVLLDTQDFTGEPFFYFVLCSLIRTSDFVALDACGAYSSVASLKKVL